MAKRKNDLQSVPAAVLPVFEEITALTNQFSKEHLNEEYAELCRKLAAALARKRPSPLVRGKPEVWAAGIVHALATINFLFDRSQKPYVPSTAIAEYFGVGASTSAAKSAEIRKMFKMGRFDHEWLTPSLTDRSLTVWLLSVNGMMVDIRMMPLEAQEVAYEQGLIPYIPHYRLLEHLESAVPITFRPTPQLIEALADSRLKVTEETDLVATEMFDARDFGGINCSIEFPDIEEVLTVSITYLIPDPEHPLAPEIEQYRKLRLDGLDLGLLAGGMADENEQDGG